MLLKGRPSLQVSASEPELIPSGKASIPVGLQEGQPAEASGLQGMKSVSIVRCLCLARLLLLCFPWYTEGELFKTILGFLKLCF